MSLPKLFPLSDDNKTCLSGVPVLVLSHEEANDAAKDAAELNVSVRSVISKRAASFVVESAIHNALRQGSTRLVFVVESYQTNEELEVLASEISCRAILQLNHKISGHHSLREICISCDPQQRFAIRRGLASQQPICFSCFKENDS